MQSSTKIPQGLQDLRYKIKSSMGQSKKIRLGKFILLERLGGGSYGDVYKAVHQDNQKYFAIKIIDKKLLFQKNKNEHVRTILKRLLETQGILMQLCNSPYVVKCYQIIEDTRFKIFILQYCNRGSLHDELKKRKVFPVNQALAILKQIIMGLSQLHKKKIIHRDLKAENIMIHNGKFKIADFGFSRQVDSENSLQTFTVLGTRTTMAPQVKNNKKYGIKADIWSIGIIFYTMICSSIEFQAEGCTGRSSDINKQIRLGSLFFSTLSGPPDSQLKNFLTSMLTIQQQDRISWKQLINHKIFTRIEGNLLSNPVQNISIIQADNTTVITDIKLQQHQKQLHNQVFSKGTNPKLQPLPQNKHQQSTQIDIQQEIRTKLNQTIKLQILDMPDISEFKKSLPVDINEVLYRQIALNNLECHKAQYIFEKIVTEIQKQQMLDFSKRTNKEFLYMMLTRCRTNLSWANNNLKYNANDEMFISYHEQVTGLFNKIDKKWKVVDQQLYKISNSWFNKIKDIKDKLLDKQKIEKADIFLQGIQITNYTKEKQIEHTQNEYIQKVIQHLKGEPNQVFEMKRKLQAYKKINEITLKDLQVRECTFYERVKAIIVNI